MFVVDDETGDLNLYQRLASRRYPFRFLLLILWLRLNFIGYYVNSTALFSEFLQK